MGKMKTVTTPAYKFQSGFAAKLTKLVVTPLWKKFFFIFQSFMDFGIAKKIMDLYEKEWPLLVQRGKKDKENFCIFLSIEQWVSIRLEVFPAGMKVTRNL